MTREIEYRLLSCKNIPEFLTMFFGLGMKDKLSIFKEEVTIEKGTNLYRIRKLREDKNPNDPKEWSPVPQEYSKNQGRFNAIGESVLYVGSDPSFLEREVRLKENEEYYLAKYVCKNTFKVGSFLCINSQVNTLVHKIVMSISDSKDLTEKENTLIDEYFDWAKRRSLFEISTDMLASLYIHKLLPDLYDYTNKLGKLVFKKNDNGIRYSSVFAPLELSGAPEILTLDGAEFGNYVLTQKGFGNIEFVSAEKKVCTNIMSLETMIEVFSEAEKKQD